MLYVYVYVYVVEFLTVTFYFFYIVVILFYLIYICRIYSSEQLKAPPCVRLKAPVKLSNEEIKSQKASDNPKFRAKKYIYKYI